MLSNRTFAEGIPDGFQPSPCDAIRAVGEGSARSTGAVLNLQNKSMRMYVSYYVHICTYVYGRMNIYKYTQAFRYMFFHVWQGL